jgi:hypothetical protein
MEAVAKHRERAFFLVRYPNRDVVQEVLVRAIADG